MSIHRFNILLFFVAISSSLSPSLALLNHVISSQTRGALTSSSHALAMLPHSNFCNQQRTHHSSTSLLEVQLSSNSDIDANVEELKSIQKKRQAVSFSQVEVKPQPSVRQPQQQKQQQTRAQIKRPSLTSIISEPIGSLSSRSLTSLCNSIRYVQKGSSIPSLNTLDRILKEIDYWQSNSAVNQSTSKPIYLKPIHVFSVLTALTNDVRNYKQQQKLNVKRSYHNQSHRESILDAQGVEKLVNVVTLLKKLLRGEDNNNTGGLNYCDEGCYTKDVPSFAVMIASEASRWEKTGLDAALLFLDMMGKEEGSRASAWDPRLIGAVLNALSVWGRAEEAQSVLERATGVRISTVSSKTASVMESGTSVTSPAGKQLDLSRAGACYNALLRAWSKRASLLAHEQQSTNTKFSNSRKISSKQSTAALAQARDILLNHMPQLGLPITNRTCAAVLQGYATFGMGAEAERVLMEIEALLLSPTYSAKSMEESWKSQSTFASSLDVACYNTVIDAYCQSFHLKDVACAERLFAAMKEQSPMNISINDSTTFQILPPVHDVISCATVLNCYSKFGMADEAEAVLNSMTQSNDNGADILPTLPCYVSVIQSLEKSASSAAPIRTMALVERMEQSRDRRVVPRPNRVIYNGALRCMAKHGCGEEAESLLVKFHSAFPSQPDIYSYTLALRAWERSNDCIEAARRARRLFGQMLVRAEEGHLPHLDVNAYNILLNCYARAGLADDAEVLLTRLESDEWMSPSSSSYSLVIKALSRSNALDAVDRAWQILHRLGYPKRKANSSSTSNETEPTFDVSLDTFNAMLRLFAKRGMASEAEELLGSIDALVVKGTMRRGGPDVQSYEAVLEAMGRRKEADIPKRAEALVTRMEVLGELGGNIQPSLKAYNTLLNW